MPPGPGPTDVPPPPSGPTWRGARGRGPRRARGGGGADAQEGPSPTPRAAGCIVRGRTRRSVGEGREDVCGGGGDGGGGGAGCEVSSGAGPPPRAWHARRPRSTRQGRRRSLARRQARHSPAEGLRRPRWNSHVAEGSHPWGCRVATRARTGDIGPSGARTCTFPGGADTAPWRG